MIKGFCYIMLFYVLGEMVSLLIGRLIPGSVCGMILLFLALTLKWVRPRDVDKAASALTRNMALFFVPASRVGGHHPAGYRCRRAYRRAPRPQTLAQERRG